MRRFAGPLEQLAGKPGEAGAPRAQAAGTAGSLQAALGRFGDGARPVLLAEGVLRGRQWRARSAKHALPSPAGARESPSVQRGRGGSAKAAALFALGAHGGAKGDVARRPATTPLLPLLAVWLASAYAVAAAAAAAAGAVPPPPSPPVSRPLASPMLLALLCCLHKPYKSERY